MKFLHDMCRGGEVAQLVEQRTENPRVIGSIPILATIFVSTPVNPTGFFVPHRGLVPETHIFLRIPVTNRRRTYFLPWRKKKSSR